MPRHPNARYYSEHWPKISVALDYRGGPRYWAVVVDLGGAVIPGEMDAFTLALKDAEAACDDLNYRMLTRIREAEHDDRNPIKAG